MTDKLKSTINIPVWALSIAITLLLAAFSFTYAFASRTGQTNEEIQYCKTEINNVKEELKTKTDDSEIDRVYKILERIENKLDQHIANK